MNKILSAIATFVYIQMVTKPFGGLVGIGIILLASLLMVLYL